jgi:signal transduction histidine kinase
VLLPKAVDLNQVLVNMSGLLRTTIGSRVPIEIRNQPGLWHALVDPNQIELVLLNLVINARDAMPDGGTLIIETGNMTLAAIGRPVDLPAGEYVVVSVTDNGTGMSDEVPAKAFEPSLRPKRKARGRVSVSAWCLAWRSSRGVTFGSQAGPDKARRSRYICRALKT